MRDVSADVVVRVNREPATVAAAPGFTTAAVANGRAPIHSLRTGVAGAMGQTGERLADTCRKLLLRRCQREPGPSRNCLLTVHNAVKRDTTGCSPAQRVAYSTHMPGHKGCCRLPRKQLSWTPPPPASRTSQILAEPRSRRAGCAPTSLEGWRVCPTWTRTRAA